MRCSDICLHMHRLEQQRDRFSNKITYSKQNSKLAALLVHSVTPLTKMILITPKIIIILVPFMKSLYIYQFIGIGRVYQYSRKSILGVRPSYNQFHSIFIDRAGFIKRYSITFFMKTSL